MSSELGEKYDKSFSWIEICSLTFYLKQTILDVKISIY